MNQTLICLFRYLVVPAILMTGASCTTAPRVDAQWVDPAIQAGSAVLRGAKVMVACDAVDFAVRQVCQDRISAQLNMRGAIPVTVAPDLRVYPDRPVDEQLAAAAQSAGAQAVLVVTPTPAFNGGGSGMSVGIGGFSFGGNGGVGLGLSAPIGGGGNGLIGFAFNGRLIDAGTGHLLWTATVVAPVATEINSQFNALSGLLLQNAQTSGLL